VTTPSSDLDVYVLSAASNSHDNLRIATKADLGRSIDGFRGESMADSWVPLRVEVHPPEFPVGPDTSTDFPGLAGIPVFGARAAEVLSDLLEGRGELLPLEVEGGGDLYRELYAFNITRLSDALDEAKSEFKRFESSGRIMRVERFEFDPGRLAGETVFKLAQKPKWHDFVTGAFMRRVQEAGLRGFSFDWRVWSPGGAAERTAEGSSASPAGPV
jgi:hypothetical protein